MPQEEKSLQLTGSLEDYLETIFELVRDRKFARVKDIAKARGVKSGSVSPAMRRLSELGLITYVEREYIDLTPAGEVEARRIFAKHQLLTRFLTQILRMSPQTAKEDACAMEHNLSAQAMDHLVRFFEFLQGCPEGIQLLARFRKCSLVHDDLPDCELDCALKTVGRSIRGKPLLSLLEIEPGESAHVCQITDTGPIRQRLLEMGIMPDVKLQIESRTPDAERISVKLQGFQLPLTRQEAECVLVIQE